MRIVSWLLTFVSIVLFPLLGVLLAQGEITYLFAFPPEFGRVVHEPFQFRLTLLIILCLPVTVVLWVLVKRRDRIFRHHMILKRRHFPKWGYAGYVLWLFSWIVAWNRFEVFSWAQPYTFTPLWLGFILVVNAHVHRLSNTSPLYKSPARFAALFGISACFWWIFEFLNRITENWTYVGVEGVSAAHYYVHGSLCFSTVLPALFSVFRWVNCHESLHHLFYIGPRLSSLRSRGYGFVASLLGIASLLCVGLFPTFSYPFIWLGPLMVYSGLQGLVRKRTGLGSWARGDWRWVAFWGLSGLLCGFWWECWNYFSLLKWEYSLSFFYGLLLFEMPLLGYLGYIPFGIFAGLVVQWIFPRRAAIEFSPE